ncbi:hypothetical protein DIURU_001767 [Diutina rugosa]|uniref:Uncharacterized protein n=1 Tax=Diutina rugosa TaxID=5481 RepID=A0A642UXT9_DIURU|nr:uncharacterized protein DIURU_001767 [Diutina rugosa]KAA8904931.1 hypothetical protein DIURU_001767 [Diutina rugosa]
MKFATSVFTLALLLVFTRTVHAFFEAAALQLFILIEAAVFLIIYTGEIPAPPSFLRQPTLPPPVSETLRIEGVTLQVADSSAELSLVVHAELSAPTSIVATPSAPTSIVAAPSAPEMSLASPAQSSSSTIDHPTPSISSTIVSSLQSVFELFTPPILFAKASHRIFKLYVPPILSTIVSSLQSIFELFTPPIFFTIASSLQSGFKFLSPSVLFGFVPSLPFLRVFSAVKELCTSVSVRLATLPWNSLFQGLTFCALVYQTHLITKINVLLTLIEQELRRVREDDNDAGDLPNFFPEREPFVATDVIRAMEHAAAREPHPQATYTAITASEARTLNPRTGTGHPSPGTSNSRPVAGSSAVAATGQRKLDPGAGTGRTSLEIPRFRPVGGSSADTASVARTLNPGAGTGHPSPGTSNSRPVAGSSAVAATGQRKLDPGAGTGRTSLETTRFRPVGGSRADTASEARNLNPGAGTGPTRPGTSNSRTDGGNMAAPENGEGFPWQEPETLAETRMAIRVANDWLQANQN